MDHDELDRRLAAGDPARATPTALDGVIGELVARPSVRVHPNRRRAVVAIGTAVVLVGGLAAFTDLDSYLLSVPPFSTLEEQTVRTTDGLAYVPVGETDHGEDCAIWIDFGGITEGELVEVNRYWSGADPDVFAENVHARMGATVDDIAQSFAQKDQLLEDFDAILPGVAWGSAPPDRPWHDGEPHITAFSTVCADDREALE
jgi:hypothetical protein